MGHLLPYLVDSTVSLMESCRVAVSDFEFKRKIAESSTSEVFLGVSRWRPLSPLAIKCIDKTKILTQAKVSAVYIHWQTVYDYAHAYVNIYVKRDVNLESIDAAVCICWKER